MLNSKMSLDGKNPRKLFKVFVNTGKAGAAQVIEVEQGAGDRGQAVRIKAQAGAKYQLQDTSLSAPVAPDYVKVKRVGKDLYIIFEDGSNADVMIQGYYAVMPPGYNGVIGQAENGLYYEYIPEDPNPKYVIPLLSDGGFASTWRWAAQRFRPAVLQSGPLPSTHCLQVWVWPVLLLVHREGARAVRPTQRRFWRPPACWLQTVTRVLWATASPT